ncbi:hypothetical protein N7532_011093 [Penicillium argentinense]|uniref:Uncharacterized protein n=1 Tax=Penicillium argentinense TaxID=1131581 RepID=A0A9W9JUL1_9EURO|nr:uncharacterized protein N7532_011093 [Penicillium argentinense]KAJ5082050.1 hypothetical protein N7532_011093 [Penicillium argentinense]
MGVNLLACPAKCPPNTLEIDERSGYIVYRTSYFAQPGTAFSRFIDAIISLVTDLLPFEDASTTNNKLESAGFVPQLWMWSQDCRVIFADPVEFDQASMDSIHAHFGAWKTSQEKLDWPATHWRCIIYDEVSRHAFLSSPPLRRGEDIELGEKGIPKAHYVKAITPTSDHDDDNYDAFMGGERSNRMGVDLDAHKTGMGVLSDSEDDEYDGFLGGSI